mmetsp:Transcript_29159/g.84784  ORF Transcript_29159/g.84784 Transcript_29159/m.84784 type:complete len:254 (+) Transcript_29159:2869-3630(+)
MAQRPVRRTRGVHRFQWIALRRKLASRHDGRPRPLRRRLRQPVRRRLPGRQVRRPRSPPLRRRRHLRRRLPRRHEGRPRHPAQLRWVPLQGTVERRPEGRLGHHVRCHGGPIRRRVPGQRPARPRHLPMAGGRRRLQHLRRRPTHGRGRCMERRPEEVVATDGRPGGRRSIAIRGSSDCRETEPPSTQVMENVDGTNPTLWVLFILFLCYYIYIYQCYLQVAYIDRNMETSDGTDQISIKSITFLLFVEIADL